jgi:hypothetical protein
MDLHPRVPLNLKLLANCEGFSLQCIRLSACFLAGSLAVEVMPRELHDSSNSGYAK